MKRFEHINDVWAALDDCKTLGEIYEVIGEVPNKFGNWYVDVDDARDEDGESKVTVTNEWWDGQLDDMYSESEDYYVVVPEEERDEEEL